MTQNLITDALGRPLLDSSFQLARFSGHQADAVAYGPGDVEAFRKGELVLAQRGLTFTVNGVEFQVSPADLERQLTACGELDAADLRRLERLRFDLEETAGFYGRLGPSLKRRSGVVVSKICQGDSPAQISVKLARAAFPELYWTRALRPWAYLCPSGVRRAALTRRFTLGFGKLARQLIQVSTYCDRYSHSRNWHPGELLRAHDAQAVGEVARTLRALELQPNDLTDMDLQRPEFVALASRVPELPEILKSFYRYGLSSDNWLLALDLTCSGLNVMFITRKLRQVRSLLGRDGLEALLSSQMKDGSVASLLPVVAEWSDPMDVAMTAETGLSARERTACEDLPTLVQDLLAEPLLDSDVELLAAELEGREDVSETGQRGPLRFAVAENRVNTALRRARSAVSTRYAELLKERGLAVRYGEQGVAAPFAAKALCRAVTLTRRLEAGQFGPEVPLGTYLFLVAASAAELQQEGRELHHCVGGYHYAQRARDGLSSLILMRGPDGGSYPLACPEGFGPLATVEVTWPEGRVAQAYGKYNSYLEGLPYQALQAYLLSLGLQVPYSAGVSADVRASVTSLTGPATQAQRLLAYARDQAEAQLRDQREEVLRRELREQAEREVALEALPVERRGPLVAKMNALAAGYAEQHRRIMAVRLRLLRAPFALRLRSGLIARGPLARPGWTEEIGRRSTCSFAWVQRPYGRLLRVTERVTVVSSAGDRTSEQTTVWLGRGSVKLRSVKFVRGSGSSMKRQVTWKSGGGALHECGAMFPTIERALGVSHLAEQRVLGGAELLRLTGQLGDVLYGMPPRVMPRRVGSRAALAAWAQSWVPGLAAPLYPVEPALQRAYAFPDGSQMQFRLEPAVRVGDLLLPVWVPMSAAHFGHQPTAEQLDAAYAHQRELEAALAAEQLQPLMAAQAAV